MAKTSTILCYTFDNVREMTQILVSNIFKTSVDFLTLKMSLAKFVSIAFVAFIFGKKLH